MLSIFFSYDGLDSLKEKIKPQLFLNKHEIIDYPIKGQYKLLKDKKFPRNQKRKHNSKRKKGR